MTYARERRTAPWLFGITNLPYGVYNGFISTAMPYLLRNAGLPVDRIADIRTMCTREEFEKRFRASSPYSLKS